MRNLLILFIFYFGTNALFSQKTPFPFSPERRSVSARTFGVIPNDGVNDYVQMKALAAFAKTAQPHEIIFENGIYDIDTTFILGTNNAESVVWDSISNCHFVGNGATFKTKGDINLSADYQSGPYWFTNKHQPCPFFLKRAKHITIEGINTDGENYLTTRSELITETSAYGITIHDYCENITIKNCKFSNSITDGGLVQSSSQTAHPKTITFLNCKFLSNSRNGASVVSGVLVKFIECVFEKNGLTNGSYAPFAPASGLDIEDEIFSPAAFSNFEISGCSFLKNGGSELIATSGEGVIVSGSYFEDTMKTSAPLISDGVLIVANGAVFTGNTLYNCDISVHENGWVYKNPAIVSDNQIKAKRYGIYHDNTTNPVIIVGNTIESRDSIHASWGTTIFPFANNCLLFSSNTIIIDTLLSTGIGRTNNNQISSNNLVKWESTPVLNKTYYFESIGNSSIDCVFDIGIPPVGITWPLSYNLSGGKYKTSNSAFLTKGTTAQRPTLLSSDPVFAYLDTTIGKPIFWDGANWIDSNGNTQ